VYKFWDSGQAIPKVSLAAPDFCPHIVADQFKNTPEVFAEVDAHGLGRFIPERRSPPMTLRI
jgi:hypothetical protein